MTKEPENLLIERAILGDLRALEVLLLRHHDRVLACVLRQMPQDLRRLHDPQDVLQDTCFEAFCRISQFQPQGEDCIFRWLATIARNRIVYLVRAQRAVKRGGGRARVDLTDESSESLAVLLEQVAIYERTPSRSAAAHELTERVQGALGRLPPHYEQVIRLHYMQGLSVAETATHMGRTENGAQVLCHQALLALRHEMKTVSLYV